MSQSDTLIIDTTDKIFREFAHPQAIVANPDNSWAASLWAALEEAGLTLAWVPEKNGGAGAEIKDGFNILKVAGRYAVSIPLAETLLAGWLLAKAGLKAPEGTMAVAFGADYQPLTIKDEKLYGCARGLWVSDAVKHIICLANGDHGLQVSIIESSCADHMTNMNMAKQEIKALTFDGVAVKATELLPNSVSSNDVMLMGAAVRAQQMGGALQALLDVSVDYAQGRQAFGRPIGKFQIIQQNLARLAGETAAATAASESAADTIQNSKHFNSSVFLEVAAAKIRVGEAATEGAAIAHQIHGAIGFTAEHVLHRYTQSLFVWREDFGTETEWAVRLGSMVAANGADQLWSMVTSR